MRGTPQHLGDVIRAAWSHHRAETIAQVEILVRYAESMQTASALPPDLVSAAHASAHRLAGSLGMFGLHEGSDLAGRLETDLATPDGPRLTAQDARAIAYDIRRIVSNGPDGDAGTP